jgi:hypothetical protein
MRRDHDAWRSGMNFQPMIYRQDADATCLLERSFPNSLSAQSFAHDRIMDQLSQNGEGSAGGELFRLGDGVTHAETGSEMFCEQYFHDLWLVLQVTLCDKVNTQKFFISFPLL